jgi:putative ABC transport system permease protein
MPDGSTGSPSHRAESRCDPSASSGSPRPFDDAEGRPEPVEGRAESSGDWKPHIRPRLASLRLSPAREAEIAEELAQHLEDRWRELVARGATPEEAAHTARTEFDGARLEALLGTLRQAHWHEAPPPGPTRAFSLDSVLIDLRHAIRALRATPSFTLGALLVLALGTGATTAIFSVADAVALRPLPFPEPDRIVAVGVRADPVVGGGGGPQRSGPAQLGRGRVMPGAKPPEPDALMSVTAQDYLDWADQQQVFEAMAALSGIGDYVFQPPGAEPEVVKGDRVTASFFDVLRVRPMLGAAFTSRDEVGGSDRVVVLSHGFWQRHLGRDPAAVGRTLALNGESYTIVGVMPAGFAYPPGSPQPADLWTLWVLRPQDRVRAGSGARSLGGHQSIARLKADVSLDQAQAQMSQVAATIASANPATNSRRGIGIRPLRDHLVGSSTRLWMLMLLGAVGIVLLITCANVANLWLARASVQQRDAAVRAALGASRGRLAQRVLIESLVVSVAGTIVGLGLAWLGVRVLAAALPDTLARVATIGIDARVLAVAGVAALTTGLISGVTPALQGSRPVLSTALTESTRGGGTGRGRRRARAALVVAEVALAVVLLVGASLFIGSFVNVMRVDPGFRSEAVLTAQIVPPNASGSEAPDLRPAFADIVDRARRLPGVIDAAAASPGVPFRIQAWIDALRAPGQPMDPSMAVSAKVVTAGYHRTLAIPLRNGRYFTDDDRDGAEAVVILSEAAARMPFAGDDPLGRVVEVAGGQRRVVGIVANARQSSLEVSPDPEVYVPMAQGPRRSAGYVLLHTSGDPNDALPALRTVVGQVLPQVPLRNIARLDDLLAAQVAERRLNMLMFSLFGLLGLVIAAVGVFGVIAYLVSQQTRDIGIRMALGATRARVIADVVGYAGWLVTGGLVVGGFAAWSLSNLAGRFLFGLDPRDARAYGVAIATLIAAALIATVLPARRAASIDPIEALRSE